MTAVPALDVIDRLFVGRSFSRPGGHPSDLATAIRAAPPRPAGDGFEDAFFASPEFLITVKRIEARQTFFEDEPGLGRLVFLFHLQGRRLLELTDTDRYDLNGPAFAVLYQAEGVSKRSIWTQGDHEAAVAIGFWPADPPRILSRPIAEMPDWQSMIRGADRPFLWIQRPLSLEMEQAARLMLDPTVHPALLEDFLVAKANELLCLGLDALLTTALAARGAAPPLLARLGEVRRTIATNLQQPPPLAALAQAADLPAATLSAAFREAYGVTVAEYVNRQRMQKARQLLVSTRRPLKQIAHELGYNHTSNLCLAFKRHFGVTPREARLTGAGGERCRDRP